MRRVVGGPVWFVTGAALVLGNQAPVALPLRLAATSSGDRAIYEPLAPARILDTRVSGQGPELQANTPRTLVVVGHGGVPADATAVVVNATVVKPSLAGYLTVWPTGQTRPISSNVNFAGGQTIANLVTVTLGSGGAINLVIPAGHAHAVVDVAGYYRGHDHDDRYLTKTDAQARTAAGAFTCSAPNFIRSVAADGTPTCAAPTQPTEPPSPYLGLPTTPGSTTTIAAGTTGSLTRDVYLENLTLGDNALLHTNGWRLFVRGTITLGNGAHIERDGGNGNTTNAGAGTGGGTLGMSGGGGCGAVADVANSLGGDGGGSAGGNVTRPLEAIGGAVAAHWAQTALTGRLLDGTKFNGGAGGEGVNCPGTPGAGGGGGGVIVIAVGTIVVTTGTASITANGGSSTGQGGGGGGAVIVASQHPQPAGLLITAAGGAGASGNGTAGTVLYLNL